MSKEKQRLPIGNLIGPKTSFVAQSDVRPQRGSVKLKCRDVSFSSYP